MSSLDRTTEADVFLHHLTRDERTLDSDLLARSDRTARTLVKEGPLRLTMLALAPGADLPEHKTDGPVSIHLLEGGAVFSALGNEYTVATDDILVLAPGVRHSAHSSPGCTFLLTVVHRPSAGSLVPGS